MTAPVPIRPTEPVQDDGVKWLCLLLRQAFLMIVAGIEQRYGLTRSRHNGGCDRITSVE